MRYGRNPLAGAMTTAVFLIVSAGQWTLKATAQSESVPDGVQMLLPRGGIPAVFDPKFVAAADADIADDAWILGIIINGEAHAYSLNLLNHHEVVNDVVGDLPVAAVW